MSDSPATYPSSIDTMAELLSTRLFQPRREALDAVQAALAPFDDPTQAWCELAEQSLIPAEFVNSQTRRFGVIDTSRGGLRANAEGEERYGHPPTLNAAETFAADISGMLSAEHLGKLLASKLVPWGGVEVTEVEWFCLSHKRPVPLNLGYAYDLVYNSLEHALEEKGEELDDLADDDPRLPAFVNRSIRAHLGWSIAIEQELEVPAAYWPSSTVKWQSFAELENPFITALELLQTGYVPGAINLDDSVLRLYTFSVGATALTRTGRN
ncbi:hypothetical protein [Haliangium ochraceum]|uniref:Uncharacterized protein n=1 Tax=Haliangium ochraceum (strain DSM 14365 / JCM 11303 / SMP-2) TaxID=502025 RepID=D0LQP1_HALO1|nr:hypothetical protein [Haliangium ochraceum]ACY13601.1 hypothetical protein Hoch_1001 [Haliangium ochraceum DSM 14365]